MRLMLFVYGCCLGSFYCLVAERLPAGQSILSPASHCRYCNHPLAFYEKIPLLSIMIQKFQCNACAQKLPSIYFVSELTGGLLFVYCFTQRQLPASLYTFLFFSMGLLLSLTDWFYLLVEPKILFFFVALLLLWHYYFSSPLYFSSAGILFLSLSFLYRLFPHALGGGDILLLGFWGLFLGWTSILLIIFIASSTALLYSLILRYWLRKKIVQIPFVPFLFLGLLVRWYYS